ncbi:bacillithiol system redox-active protein YtxJ [Paenibacillus sp. PCH8]|uniref:bacillithiol system redox-active protein YtxJ n=1 Tax=Paenibacillus sp. PCH8 TaxID=2066524 RepID=UPI000CF908C5|nr:bacillithiol system redox-active protein YtxJ [Paenibacillus sp. PCH8]PQP80430.1 bacillithiol system redox-active protein YtxJ [Paenibacillus sp. PCH8]
MADMTKMTSIEQLNSAVEATEDQPLLLFKHSTRCPISAHAYQEMNDYLHNTPNEQVKYGIIYVVEDRTVSNEAAEQLGVKHESPQAILIKKGIPVWHTSHSDITTTTLTNVLSES